MDITLTNVAILWMVVGLVFNTYDMAVFKYRNPEYLPTSVYQGVLMLLLFLVTIPFWPLTIVSLLDPDG